MDHTDLPAAGALIFQAATEATIPPWRLDLSDRRYVWPGSFAVSLAARTLATWRAGGVVLQLGLNPDVFAVSRRDSTRMGVAAFCAVLAASIHADRVLLRLPEAIVRERHADDIQLLEDVAVMSPLDLRAATAGDAVGLDLVVEHTTDICELAQMLEAVRTLQAEDLMLFATGRCLWHRPRPLLLAQADDAEEPTP